MMFAFEGQDKSEALKIIFSMFAVTIMNFFGLQTILG